MRCPENFVDDEAFAAYSVQSRAIRHPMPHVRCPWLQAITRVSLPWPQFLTRGCHAKNHWVIAGRVVDTHVYPVIMDVLVGSALETMWMGGFKVHVSTSSMCCALWVYSNEYSPDE
jgi:hypothetical protein